MDKELRHKIIRLAKEKPELREHLLPLVARSKPSSLGLIDKKIKSFESQSRAYLDKLKEIKGDLERAYSSGFRTYRVGQEALERVWSNSDDWIDIRKDTDDILRAISEDLRDGHFKR